MNDFERGLATGLALNKVITVETPPMTSFVNWVQPRTLDVKEITLKTTFTQFPSNAIVLSKQNVALGNLAECLNAPIGTVTQRNIATSETTIKTQKAVLEIIKLNTITATLVEL